MQQNEAIAYPEWTEYRKKNGLDPLGMQTGSVNLYQDLVPGISNVSVDLSSNRDIDHLNIDKSPELHARVLSEVLAVIRGRLSTPASRKPISSSPAPNGSAGPATSAPTPAAPLLQKPVVPAQPTHPSQISN